MSGGVWSGTMNEPFIVWKHLFLWGRCGFFPRDIDGAGCGGLMLNALIKKLLVNGFSTWLIVACIVDDLWSVVTSHIYGCFPQSLGFFHAFGSYISAWFFLEKKNLVYCVRLFE